VLKATFTFSGVLVGVWSPDGGF